MPTPTPGIAGRVLSPRPTPGQVLPDGRYVVKRADSLFSIAERFLGDGRRWPELAAENQGLLKGSRILHVGMALRLPAKGKTPASPTPSGDRFQRSQPVPVPPPSAERPLAPSGPVPTPTPAPRLAPRQELTPKPQPVAPKPPSPPVVAPVPLPNPARTDSDGDGVVDRFDRKPQDPKVKGWNAEAAQAYADFVRRRAPELASQGLEVDCADFAAKLLADFCQETGLPNPMAGVGQWHEYRPGRTGGLPNVEGVNLVLTQVGADQLAKRFTRAVNDANGNGIAGFNRETKEVDVADLRPGDILFYDWDQDGVVNHTMNVIDRHEDGSVTLAWGTYDNTKPGEALSWESLDLKKVEVLRIQPGSEEYQRFFGPGAAIWGARRFSPMADQAKPFPLAS